MSYKTWDVLSICVYSISGFLGIFGNAALLVALKCRSPRSWGSYTILIANSALIDLVACVSATMSMERAVLFKQVTASAFLGPCSLISGFACHVLHSITLHSVSESLFLIVISLCYRLYILGNSPPSKWKMATFCIVIYIPSFAILFASFFMNNSSVEVKEALKQLEYFEYDQIKSYVIEGRVDNQPRRLVKLVQAYMVLPVFPLTIIAFILRNKVIGKINAKGDSMSERTREMHKTLIKILTLQASLPILFLFMIICYILMKANIYNSPFISYSAFWYLAYMSSLAPLVTLYFVTPFRNFVLRREANPSNQSKSSVVQSVKIDDQH